MTTKNEKKQMEAKGGKKCTQSKAKERIGKEIT